MEERKSLGPKTGEGESFRTRDSVTLIPQSIPRYRDLQFTLGRGQGVGTTERNVDVFLYLSRVKY